MASKPSCLLASRGLAVLGTSVFARSHFSAAPSLSLALDVVLSLVKIEDPIPPAPCPAGGFAIWNLIRVTSVS